MSRWQADLGLVLITLIWGSTFVVVKQSLDSVSPLFFVASRFWVGTLALLALYGLRRPAQPKPLTPALLRDGVLTGLFLTGGFITQTIGLQSTEASKAAFITGLNVVLVPLFAALLLRQPPAWHALAGVALSTVGLAVMTLDPTLTLARGDLWVMACAAGFAMHIIAISRYSARHELFPYTLVQLLTTALIATLASLLLEQNSFAAFRVVLPAILYMGVIATALVFGLQTWVQRYTTPTHTALIFALEPVFAALFAIIFANETLENKEWFGGALILLGMLLAESVDAWQAARARKATLNPAGPGV
ncbi:MAG: DMT family transporter [Ardenticatenales bacterium]|nr:DMT family transporter [Ardenticatenales bacterium]